MKQCTLTDGELIEKVQEWVSRLCKSGGREWTLCVPPQFNRDPDFLITELCKRFNTIQPDGSVKTCNGNCGMNYCDENGCIERKRVITEPIEPESNDK